MERAVAATLELLGEARRSGAPLAVALPAAWPAPSRASGTSIWPVASGWSGTNAAVAVTRVAPVASVRASLSVAERATLDEIGDEGAEPAESRADRRVRQRLSGAVGEV